MRSNFTIPILENNHNMSLGYIALLFYIAVSSSYLSPLLSKQLNHVLDNNRYAKHILGITSLMALIIMMGNGKFSTARIVLYTIIGYLWFIMTTKLELQWNIAILVMVMAYVLYQNDCEHRVIVVREMGADILSDKEKDRLEEHEKNKYIGFGCIIILTTVLGTLFYSNKKEGQYGGGYSLVSFLLH